MRTTAAITAFMLLAACDAHVVPTDGLGCARAPVMHLPGGVALVALDGRTYHTLEDPPVSVRMGSAAAFLPLAPTAEAWREGPPPDAAERRRAVVIDEALPMIGRRIATADETGGRYPDACAGLPLHRQPGTGVKQEKTS